MYTYRFSINIDMHGLSLDDHAKLQNVLVGALNDKISFDNLNEILNIKSREYFVTSIEQAEITRNMSNPIELSIIING